LLHDIVTEQNIKTYVKIHITKYVGLSGVDALAPRGPGFE